MLNVSDLVESKLRRLEALPHLYFQDLNQLISFNFSHLIPASGEYYCFCYYLESCLIYFASGNLVTKFLEDLSSYLIASKVLYHAFAICLHHYVEFSFLVMLPKWLLTNSMAARCQWLLDP